MKNSVQALLLCALALTAFTSCQQELEGNGKVKSGKGNTVSFSVNSPVTKAGAIKTIAAPVEIYEIEGTEIDLVETVECLDPVPATKGIPVYNENVSEVYPNLAVTAFSTSTKAQWGKADVKFDYVESSNRVYSHNYSEGADADYTKWPDKGNLRFFVRAPYYTSGDPCSSVNYTLTNDSALATIQYTTPDKAIDQKDLLFGSTELTFEDKESETNNVLLYHALTGVKFKIADECINNSDETKKITITKVALNKVVSSGTGKIETINSGKNSAEVVYWETAPASTKRFEQAFSGLVTADKEDKEFADSFYGTSSENNLNAEDFSLTFWLIPQALDAVTADITYYVGKDASKALTVTVSFGTGKEWNAGELHTYTLTPKTVGVDIEDDVDGQIKSNVTITNISNMPEYIRVAVIANWVDANNNVVESMTPALTLKANWEKQGEYYYYTKEINPGLQPGQVSAGDPVDYIFDQYEVPVAEKPEKADHLVMSLAVQAIDTQAKKDYKEAWKAANVTFIE